MKRRRLRPKTLDLFYGKSTFATEAFVLENVTMMDSLEIIASGGQEFGIYS